MCGTFDTRNLETSAYHESHKGRCDTSVGRPESLHVSLLRMHE
jgi:hypothetical protein